MAAPSLWQRRFGGDATVIGKALTLNGRSRTVLGVMPPGFKFPTEDVEMWVPLALEASSTNLRVRYLEVAARLGPGFTPEQAKAEMKAVAERIARKYPEYYKQGAGPEVAIVPLHEQIVGDTRPALLVLLGGVGFMLLIACTNVANLFLSRAAARKKEIATRTAFGASRMRIVRQLLTESLLLFALGGALGLLLALWGVRVLVLMSPLNIPRMSEVNIDLWTLTFTAITSLLTGIFFGLAPALQASKTDLNEALKEGGRSSAETGGQSRTRNLLVVSEIALSFVLLIGAGLMVRSFSRLSEVRLGFDPENVLTMRLSLPGAKYPESRQVAAFYQELMSRLKAQPGVQAAAATSQLPLGEVMANASFEIEGRKLEEGIGIADYNIISPDYFRAMNVPVLQGRSFAETDGRQSPAPVIVNQTLARKVWPGEEPMGKRLRLTADSPWLSVVGVAADIKNHGLSTETKPEMYFPHVETQFGLGSTRNDMTLVVRSGSDPKVLVSAVRGTIWSLDRDLPVYRVQTMTQIVSDSISRTRFTAALLSLFACLALLLAGVGVYGVMSYTVARRTHEVGIREALGARPRDIVGLFVRQGFVLALAGVGLGLVGALVLTRVMSSLLYDVGATDPLTFAAISILLVAVALLACYLPARRAIRGDPMAALRNG
jgi:predicted permease